MDIEMMSFNIVVLTCKAVARDDDPTTRRAPDKWRKDQALPYKMRAQIFYLSACAHVRF